MLGEDYQGKLPKLKERNIEWKAKLFLSHS